MAHPNRPFQPTPLPRPLSFTRRSKKGGEAGTCWQAVPTAVSHNTHLQAFLFPSLSSSVIRRSIFFLLFIYDDPRPAPNFKVSLFRPVDQFAGRPINSRINNSLRLNISNYRKRRIHSIYYNFSEDAFNCSLFSRAMKILRRIFLHLFSTEMNE